MARAPEMDQPTMIAFDLDPGPPATNVECAQVALELKLAFDHLGLEAFPKTSGSKGMQVYLPLNTPGITYDDTREFSRGLAQLLERRDPKRVVSDMSKAKRTGKVFVDWSQNDRHKTTVNVYSLRALERPTVSTPLSWDEVSDLADADEPLSFTSDRGAGAGGLAGRPVRAGADAGAGAAALEQRAPVVGRRAGPARCSSQKSREDVGEALRIVVVGHVAGALEHLEPTRGHRFVRLPAVRMRE